MPILIAHVGYCKHCGWWGNSRMDMDSAQGCVYGLVYCPVEVLIIFVDLGSFEPTSMLLVENSSRCP